MGGAVDGWGGAHGVASFKMGKHLTMQVGASERSDATLDSLLVVAVMLVFLVALDRLLL